MLALTLLATLLSATTLPIHAQVTATNLNGATNPSTPSLASPGTAINQTSLSRLLSLNGVDDFCLYGPPEAGPDSTIGNVEPIVVAYCLQARNGARLIPDGTIQAAHFVKTPLYVQIYGFFDGTKINIPAGDQGGELDPHGAENLGNPIGGNVTSNVTGSDVWYEEWMSFISYSQFCLRICTAENGNYTAALMCQHELDVMGCQFVMPGHYENNTFTSCDADAGEGPGIYPLANGSSSTFKQRYTGSYTDAASSLQYWTVGDLTTPTAAYTTPASSNCVTYSTISNGIDTANLIATSIATSTSVVSTQASGTSVRTTAPSSSGTAVVSSSGSGAAASGVTSSSGARASYLFGGGEWANMLSLGLTVGAVGVGMAVWTL